MSNLKKISNKTKSTDTFSNYQLITTKQRPEIKKKKKKNRSNKTAKLLYIAGKEYVVVERSGSKDLASCSLSASQ